MAISSRRTFLKNAAIGSLALGGARNSPARNINEKPVVGLIGCGGRGRRFFEFAEYVCDPDSHHLAKAATEANIDSRRAFSDMRRLFDDPSIDAVVIATPDHWHTPAALLALEAGKHVYIEKPASHNFRESQLLLEAAQRSGLVVQHGTQQRSSPPILEAVAMLQDGIIGRVLVARAWNVQFRPNIGRANPSEPPAGLDYDLWVGPAEFLPFQSNRLHYNWHWWYAFGTGDIGNDGTHELDLARWGLGIDTLPSKISAIGGKYFHEDDQQFPDTATCVFEYPGNGQVGQQRKIIFEMQLWSTNYPYNCDNGVEFIGTDGKMVLSKRGKIEVFAPRNKPLKQERFEFTRSMEHMKDFLEAIRMGRPPAAPIEETHRSTALVHLANVSLRVGRSLIFDPVHEQILDDKEATTLLQRAYREGGHWAIPHGV
jgi:predicted dehydrogenase